MSRSILQELQNSLAYGSVIRSQIPGDIEEYHVTLIKETLENHSIVLKLKFVHKINVNNIFFITIDSVRSPSNVIMLLHCGEKGEQEDKKPFAKFDAKIKNKMILSIEKTANKFEAVEAVEEEQENDEDSDIPRHRVLQLIQGFSDMEESESKQSPPPSRQKRFDYEDSDSQK